MQILCVLIPHFPIQCEVQKNPSLKDCPAIVTYSAGSQSLVLDWSDGLKGIQPDMPLQQALSLHGEAGLISADMIYYSDVFEHLLVGLENVSPLVEGAEPGCAYLGMKGMQLFFGTNEALVDAARLVIPKTFEARIGIADGKFPAYLAAQYSPPGGFRIFNENSDSFLKDLPCDILPISLKSKQKLRDFGLRTLKQLSALQVGPLQSQFGPEGKRILELARGIDTTPLYPRNTKDVIEMSTEMPSATVAMEAILAGVESLLSAIFAQDALNGKGICGLLLWANISGSGHWEQHIKFKEPYIHVKNTLSRIRQVLEIHPPPGPVEDLGIRVTALGWHPGKQTNLFADIRAQDHLLNDIKQMEVRLGGPQVFKIKEIEPWSRIPERRQALVPINQ
jgi:DNA polymerase IV